MLFFNCAARRAVAYGIAAGATAAAALFAAAPAIAEPPNPPPAPGEPASPPPNCTAADLAGVSAQVAAAASAYLFTHPDVNAYLTSLKGQPREELRGDIQDYFDANPGVGADLRGIRQPLNDLQDRCQ